MFKFNTNLIDGQTTDTYPEPAAPIHVDASSKASIYEPEVFPQEPTTTTIVVNKVIETMYDLVLETLHTYSIIENDKKPLYTSMKPYFILSFNKTRLIIHAL